MWPGYPEAEIGIVKMKSVNIQAVPNSGRTDLRRR
jgi:hypothetical protein